MLNDFVTRILPQKLIGVLGEWCKPKVTRSKLLTFVYYYLLYGIRLKFLPDGNCLVSYHGTEMTIQRESVNILWEVFRDQVYEQFYSPKKGDTVIDIGANVGAFTVRAAKLVGDKGMVIAIEPEPRNLVLLQQNIKQNNLNNVKIVKKAIWDKPTKIRLYLSEFSGGHSIKENATAKNYIEVEADCLDNIISELELNHIDFIKLDVEGAELEALKGAEKTLAYPGLGLCIEAGHNLPNGQSELPCLVSFLVSQQFHPQVYLKAKYPYIYATKEKETRK